MGKQEQRSNDFTRATFIVRTDYLEKIDRIKENTGLDKKEILDEALELFFRQVAEKDLKKPRKRTRVIGE